MVTPASLLLALLTIASSAALHVKIGTRPSPLAIFQAEFFSSAIVSSDPSVTVEIICLASTGDVKGRKRQDTPLALAPPDFVGAIDDAVVDGTVDVGVHSLKDVPPDDRWMHGGEGGDALLTIACHLPRASPFDVLLGGASLSDLPPDARIGSSSIRRQAQLLSIRPDVTPVNLRGDVRARLDALDAGEVDALVLARAGLERLNIDWERMRFSNGSGSALLTPEEMLPGCAQGIIGAVCRSDNAEIRELLRSVDDSDTRIAALAERAVLSAVDGLAPWEGRPPLAALMQRSEVITDEEGMRPELGWELRAMLAHPDGEKVLKIRRTASAACSNKGAIGLGREVGKELLKQAGPSFFV